MKVYEGKLVSNGKKFGIVVSRFNEFITSKLLSGAKDALVRHGVADDDISVAWVPGAFEIPLVAQKMAKSDKYLLYLELLLLIILNKLLRELELRLEIKDMTQLLQQ